MSGPRITTGAGGGPVLVNVAATCVGTRALGPGHRSVVWVQGCPFHCQGCIAPDWIPQRPARLMTAPELVGELLADPAVDGLTFSGGEPMLQAAALAEVARLARTVRDVSLISFTGYQLAGLRKRHSSPGVAALLAEVDVLIDGQYVAERNNGRGLRGSSNQQIHHLTDRLTSSGYDFAERPRSAEIRIADQEVTLVGVPPLGLLDTFERLTKDAGVRS